MTSQHDERCPQYRRSQHRCRVASPSQSAAGSSPLPPGHRLSLPGGSAQSITTPGTATVAHASPAPVSAPVSPPAPDLPESHMISAGSATHTAPDWPARSRSRVSLRSSQPLTDGHVQRAAPGPPLPQGAAHRAGPSRSYQRAGHRIGRAPNQSHALSESPRPSIQVDISDVARSPSRSDRSAAVKTSQKIELIFVLMNRGWRTEQSG